MKYVRIILSLLIVGLICSGCLVRLQKHTASLGADGVVLDARTRSPIHDASVSVPDYAGRARPVSTGEDGRFSICAVQRRTPVIIMADFAPPGRILVVSREGYEPASIDLSMQQTNFVEVVLSPVSR